jgi:hypothetical protein
MLTELQRAGVIKNPFHPDAREISQQMESEIARNMATRDDVKKGAGRSNSALDDMSEPRLFIVRALTDTPQSTKEIREQTNKSAYRFLNLHIANGVVVKKMQTMNGSLIQSAMWSRGPRWEDVMEMNAVDQLELI